MTNMTQKLTELSDEEFNKFFDQLPLRVQILIKGKLVAWQEVLPEYYKLYKHEKMHQM